MGSDQSHSRITLDSNRRRKRSTPSNDSIASRIGSILNAIPTRVYVYALLGILTAGAGAYVVFHGWDSARNAFLQNPDFAVTNIVIQGNQVFDDQTIQRYTQIYEDRSIYAYDLNAIRARMLTILPGLRDIQLRRILPGTIRIEVSEREPIAKISRNNPNLTIDADGYVFLAKTGQIDYSRQLPYIFNRDFDKLDPGCRAGSSVITALHVLDILSSLRINFKVRFLDTNDPDFLTLFTHRNTTIKLPWTALETKDRIEHLIYLCQSAMDSDSGQNFHVFTAVCDKSKIKHVWKVVAD